MNKKTIISACLAIGLAPLVWLWVAYASGPPTLDQTGGFSYTFSFYCPINSYDCDDGESEVFYPRSNGYVKLWCTDRNWTGGPGGPYPEIDIRFYRNGVCLNLQDDGARLCKSWEPWPVVTTDQLKMRIEICCNSCPPGTVTVKGTCLDASLTPGPCVRMVPTPE